MVNNSSRAVVVNGGTGAGRGHGGKQVSLVLEPGGRIDANNPRDGLSDVDSVDFDGDGVAQPPRGFRDLWPRGEKIPGTDRGIVVRLVDSPRGGKRVIPLPWGFVPYCDDPPPDWLPFPY